MARTRSQRVQSDRKAKRKRASRGSRDGPDRLPPAWRHLLERVRGALRRWSDQGVFTARTARSHHALARELAVETGADPALRERFRDSLGGNLLAWLAQLPLALLRIGRRDDALLQIEENLRWPELLGACADALVAAGDPKRAEATYRRVLETAHCADCVEHATAMLARLRQAPPRPKAAKVPGRVSKPDPVPLTMPAFVSKHVRVGRNDPCPCGSGRKYKKCCLGAPRRPR